MVELKVSFDLGASRAGAQHVVLVGDVAVLGLARQVAQRQLHHAQEVIPRQSVLVEDLEDELVRAGLHPEHELLLPSGIQGPFLSLGQHRVLHLLPDNVHLGDKASESTQ